MKTCLFTGAPLGTTTHEEHTIPAKLGGRIRSRAVACDDFNNQCGSTIDRVLVDSYWQLMSSLAPLLSNEHRPGQREVVFPDRAGHYFIDSHGVLNAKGMTITARDPETGRPTGVAAKDEDAVLRVLEPNKPDGAIIKTYWEPPVTGRCKLPQSVLSGPGIELAALKAGLLTFDAQLSADPSRFTRSLALQEVRNAIRAAVMDGAEVGSFLYTVSLGIQYEKIDLFRRLRAQLDFQHSEFEHVLIASANVATRTLDLVVWLFETDPYGFRLTTDWQGKGFTYCVVNGVLRGTKASNATELPSTHLLCQRTLRRCTTPPAQKDPERRAAEQEISDVRTDAVRRAVYLTLQESDDFVRKSLSYAALPHGEQCITVCEAVRSTFIQLYEQRLEDDSLRKRFNTIVDKHTGEMPTAVRGEAVVDETDFDEVSWPIWIGVFRTILQELRCTLGPPGDGEMKVAAAERVE